MTEQKFEAKQSEYWKTEVFFENFLVNLLVFSKPYMPSYALHAQASNLKCRAHSSTYYKCKQSDWRNKFISKKKKKKHWLGESVFTAQSKWCNTQTRSDIEERLRFINTHMDTILVDVIYDLNKESRRENDAMQDLTMSIMTNWTTDAKVKCKINRTLQRQYLCQLKRNETTLNT